jgi:hypothetical protein
MSMQFELYCFCFGSNLSIEETSELPPTELKDLKRSERSVATTVVPPYSRVIRSKIYRGYVKPRIIPSATFTIM